MKTTSYPPRYGRRAFPYARIIDVERDRAEDFWQSLETHSRTTIANPESIGDGLLSYSVGVHNWSILQRYVVWRHSVPEVAKERSGRSPKPQGTVHLTRDSTRGSNYDAATERANRRGIVLMFLTSLVFAFQDGLSKHLAQAANPVFVVMIRYWAFMVFATILSARRSGGLRAAIRSRAPGLQILRGVLLPIEIVVTVAAFTLLGLAETHAIFAVCPLIIVALSGPVLGEKVGWRRWTAVGAGFVGVLVILRPGTGVFAWEALTALAGAALFAAYGLLTRLAARHDPASTSFFWTGIAGGAFMTILGPFWWEKFATRDWLLMGLLCVTGATGHYLLISAFEAAEAAVIQPFAYLTLVFASLIGVFVFAEEVDYWTVVGAAIVVTAGLYSFWHDVAKQRARPTSTGAEGHRRA